MSRPSAIMPVKRVNNFINIALYGEPGVGKSVMAGTSEKALILTHTPDEMSSASEWGSNAQMWHIKDIAEMEEALEFMRHDGVKEFDWVWIDNLTLLQDIFMDNLMEQLVIEKPHRNRWVPDMHEYLQIQNQISTYVRQFTTMPVHFGWTAHVMRAEDEDGRIEYIPMIQGGQGQLSQKLCGWANIVAYMYAVRKDGKEVRKINVGKRSKFHAKSRFRGLQGEMMDPSIPKLMEAVRSRFPALGTKPSDKKTSATARSTKKRKVA